MNRIKTLHLSTTFNLIIVIGVAFLGYFISELLSMSGILTIFITGAIMSHHHWYSIPEAQRPTVYSTVGTLSFLSETVTFISVGITLFNPANLKAEYWNPLFIVYVLALCFVSRALNVFPIAIVYDLCRRKKTIRIRHMVMLWFAGLRGAIAVIQKRALHKMFIMFDELVLKPWFGGQPRKEKELATIDPLLAEETLETDQEKVDRKFKQHHYEEKREALLDGREEPLPDVARAEETAPLMPGAAAPADPTETQ